MSRKEELNFHKQKVLEFPCLYLPISYQTKPAQHSKETTVFTGSLSLILKIGFLLKFILPLGNVILVKTQRLS